MGDLAYLAPVGPFAGLSNAVRHEISNRFPRLSVAEIESAAERFSRELQAPRTEPRLVEARDKLNEFGKELARFQGAVSDIRKRHLDRAIGEASRMMSGENEFETIEQSLGKLRTALQETSRALPVGGAQLATRRLIATLATHMHQAGLPITTSDRRSLPSLVNMIFDDLMVGGNATSAVIEWQKGQSTDTDHDPVGILIDLVVS